MKINRRSVLAGATGGVTFGVLGTGIVTADEAKGDPLPNPNVPNGDVSAFPNQEDPLTVETGEWITFSNGWISSESIADECDLPSLLNNTTQTFIIDGEDIDREEFVLDSFDDWEFRPDPESEGPQGGEVFCGAGFSHSIQPQSPGTRLSFRWEFEVDNEDAVDREYDFPHENEIKVVRRSGGQ